MNNRQEQQSSETFQVLVDRKWRRTLLNLKAEFDLSIKKLIEDALKNAYGEYLKKNVD